MTRIGIFGGTFDPPHLGHLILASEALEQLALDRLLWMIVAQPPHKRASEISPLDQRLTLTRAAINPYPQFELSLVDVNRPGPHYAADTVDLVQAQYPDAQIFYLMGGDSLRDLPNWHDPDQLIATCAGLGVMRRPGTEAALAELDARFPGIRQKIIWFQTPLMDISSHEIRNRIRQQRHYQFFLPESVYALIESNHYYQNETGD